MKKKLLLLGFFLMSSVCFLYAQDKKVTTSKGKFPSKQITQVDPTSPEAEKKRLENDKKKIAKLEKQKQEEKEKQRKYDSFVN